MSTLVGVAAPQHHDPQRQAADPAWSAWVAASAGTGKTKVLTDRVLNLLLNGTPPHRILCLTFTKAAASEMQTRIADQLSQWMMLPQQELVASLAARLDRAPRAEEVSRARRLFASVLDAPGGLHIQTIHAFCQALIGRFPLEAGVAPHFSVADERTCVESLEEAANRVLLTASADPRLDAAIGHLSGLVSAGDFSALLRSVIRDAAPLRRCMVEYGGTDGLVDAVYRRLGVCVAETPEQIIAAACADEAFDAPALQQAASALVEGKSGDVSRANAVRRWLSSPVADRQTFFSDYSRSFLRADNASILPEAKSDRQLCTQALASTYSWLRPTLLAEADRLRIVSMAHRAAITACATESIIRIGLAVVDAYTRIKSNLAFLDFDDLIDIAAHLLEQDGYAAWILYKLDGGIDHILIDEAQDTSRQQWRIIKALTADFFSGNSATNGQRTIFVVGDVKQSIFSFQGASPAAFVEQRALFRDALCSPTVPLYDATLNVSFRSASAILDCVDAVFAQERAFKGVALDDLVIRHRVSPRRQDDGGLVEVWPPVVGREEDPAEPWRPPVERIAMDAPHVRLARLLALRIRSMLTERELLPSKGRPIEPGDIMLLVRRRDAFLDEFIRISKELGIAVAGIDRLVLGEQIAVLDLIAIGKFVLMPLDDLNLATVLKGPLIGVSEDSLFRIAHLRPGSLWKALEDRSAVDRDAAEAHAYLTQLLKSADYEPPFEFFARILGPMSGRQRLLARLGQEAEEPIAEFTDLALQYQQKHPPSLQGFIHWIERSNIVVKRDLEPSKRNVVRIVTVHGAKGLQAPIVLLPDTMQVPTGRGSAAPPPILWDSDADLAAPIPLWVPPGGYLTARTASLRSQQSEQRLAEYRRLLYVAMTRAEDRLLICGWHRKKQADGCWYQVIREGLLAASDRLALQQTTDPFLVSAKAHGYFDGDPVVLRVESPQRRSVSAPETPPLAAEQAMPPWIKLSAPEEPRKRPPIAPSRIDQDRHSIRHCLRISSNTRLKRGRLIHRLLQGLPAVPPTDRLNTARRWLARPEHDLDPEEQRHLADKIVAIVNNTAFADLFGADSLAEVPIVGTISGQMISGRIDRLVVRRSEIVIVDFKTDAPVPTVAPPPYLRQMNFYREALRAAYPYYQVTCLLLWTDTPSVMRLDDRVLDRFMP